MSGTECYPTFGKGETTHYIPVKPFLGDFLRKIIAADKGVPAFSLPPLFSFWLRRLHYLIDTPLHTVLGEENRAELSHELPWVTSATA